jgi:hypothetical protein
MPVFTFEKISPPVRRVSPSPVSEPVAVTEKPRSVIVQFLDRFVETRVKRKVTSEKPDHP